MCLVTQSCLTLWGPMDCSWPGSSVHGDSPGKNTGVGCQALLQGIFPTQGLKVSPPLAGGFFTTSATWEAHIYLSQWNADIEHNDASLTYDALLYKKLYIVNLPELTNQALWASIQKILYFLAHSSLYILRLHYGSGGSYVLAPERRTSVSDTFRFVTQRCCLLVDLDKLFPCKVILRCSGKVCMWVWIQWQI